MDKCVLDWQLKFRMMVDLVVDLLKSLHVMGLKPVVLRLLREYSVVVHDVEVILRVQLLCSLEGTVRMRLRLDEVLVKLTVMDLPFV